MVAIAVPKVRLSQAPSARGEMKALARPQIILTLVAGSVGFGGMFAVYTYITPTMTEVAHVPGTAIPWVLAVYGLGMTAGSLIAGPLVDKSIERSGVAGMVLSAIVLSIFGAFTQIAAIAIVALFFIGIAGSMITTALQMRLLRDSTDAPSLAAAMNHAAFNLANALGAWLGGIVITAGLGYRAPAWGGSGSASPDSSSSESRSPSAEAARTPPTGRSSTSEADPDPRLGEGRTSISAREGF